MATSIQPLKGQATLPSFPGMARPLVVVLFMCVYLLWSAFVNLVLFRFGWFSPIVQATGGLINATLLANLLMLALGIGTGLIWLGRVHPGEIGLVWARLPVAVLWTMLLWIVAQVVLGILALVATGSVTIDPRWVSRPTAVIGSVIGQVFGNALVEEIAFRGFLLSQLYLWLQRMPRMRSNRGMIVAVVLSQAIFALLHIPNRIVNNLPLAEYPVDLLLVFALGCFFALIYVYTKSLFLAIGVHALDDAPAALFASDYASLIIILLAAIMLVFWKRIRWHPFSTGDS